VDTGRPYTEEEKGIYRFREFDQNISEEELVWHRDEEDRIVEAVEPTDWLFQFDNELPQPITWIFIPKGVYHRVIKGSGTLKIKIKDPNDCKCSDCKCNK
jgi:hypothetical protein